MKTPRRKLNKRDMLIHNKRGILIHNKRDMLIHKRINEFID